LACVGPHKRSASKGQGEGFDIVLMIRDQTMREDRGLMLTASGKWK